MTQSLRTAVIGVGHLGKWHAQKYAAMADACLVAVSDINKDAADKVAQETGATAVYDYHDLAGRVDAVSVAASTPTHYEIGRFCLEQGIDVMMEKPITMELAEADELIRLAEEKGRILQIGHVERFNPAMAAAREHLRAPFFIEARRFNPPTGRSTNVDVVLDLMIHDLDHILAMATHPVASISAVGTTLVTPYTDKASAHILFENGCIATVATSRAADKNASERSLRVFQPDECLHIDMLNTTCTRYNFKEPGSQGGVEVFKANGKPDALNDELCAFISCVRKRTPPMVSGVQGRNALALALAIMELVHKHSASMRPLR